jgi:hypothetical protein
MKILRLNSVFRLKKSYFKKFRVKNIHFLNNIEKNSAFVIIYLILINRMTYDFTSVIVVLSENYFRNIFFNKTERF